MNEQRKAAHAKVLEARDRAARAVGTSMYSYFRMLVEEAERAEANLPKELKKDKRGNFVQRME